MTLTFVMAGAALLAGELFFFSFIKCNHIIMSPPFRVGRHIVFARVVCPSVCHKVVSTL